MDIIIIIMLATRFHLSNVIISNLCLEYNSIVVVTLNQADDGYEDDWACILYAKLSIDLTYKRYI